MPAAFPLLVPENTVHHLDSLASEIHRTYFSKIPPLAVRWGQQITRKRRRSIRLGSYNHVTTEIRIHPLLNAANIPTVVIESIIHHEYLHHILGPHHNRKFHLHERQFRHHRESQEWIRRNLFVLLGRKRSELQPRRGRVVVIPPQAPLQFGQMALF
jgi:predicted metal-dependent hydrolase